MALTDEKQLIRAWEAFEANEYRMKDSQGDLVTKDEVADRRHSRLPILRELIDEYLAGERALEAFKSDIDGQNKQYPYWGFKGANGQMFFNMLASSAGDDYRDELDELIKSIIQPPSDHTDTKEKIRSLEGFVERLRNEADNLRKAPRSGSIPYFLSYFWHVHAPNRYPIYFTSMVNALSDLAIWEPTDDLAESYVEFWDLNEAMRDVLAAHTEQEVHLWTVEHVFWHWQQRDEFDELPDTEASSTTSPTIPDSYIPPIVSILPDLANGTEEIREVVEGTGNTVEGLFENRLVRAFRILGFDVEPKGQGSGRNPDGVVKDHLHNYAIVYDAKSRENGYRMRTSDERQFQDYINREVPSLRAQGFRNVYFAVVSGAFRDDGRDVIRTLKISTDIQEVRLIEAEALLLLVEHSLRNPQFGLGPGDHGTGLGFQDFFAESGVLTASDAREELGV